MATSSRSEDLALERSPLAEALERAPWSFGFFQAVRLLQRLTPGRQPVGRFVRPSAEVVHFSAHASMAFPASEIQALSFAEGGPSLMQVNFMGLTGPLGVLPLYYTDFLMERLRAHDATIRDFLDIFNHRMISLFYSAWEKYRPMVAYERDRSDPFSQHLLELIGLGTPGLQNRLAVHDEALIFYGGLLGLHARSAVALENMISDYFDVPVKIEPFVGVWRSLDASTQFCMDACNTESEQLGFGAVVGDEVWDRQSRVRLTLGPLTAGQYLSFLPNGNAYDPLRALTRFFGGSELEFEVQLVLKKDEVPGCELGAEGEEAPQLGWFTWMKSKPVFGRDPDDTILLLN